MYGGVKQRMTRDESRARTRELLLESARRVFARGGYGGASVDVIAEEAGFSKGAFYSNFPSKESIFLELLARHMAREAAELDALLTRDDPLTEVQDWLRTLNRDADWSLLAMELQLHAHRSPAFAVEYEKLNAAHRARLGALLTGLFSAKGKSLPCPAGDLAAALMALAQGLVLQRGPTENGADPAGPLIAVVLQSMIAAAAPARGETAR